MVTDDEIFEAYRFIAGKEGIFCEPASAAGVAGLYKRRSEVKDGMTVVLTLTGHGLKDPDTAIDRISSDTVTIPAELNAVKKELGF